MKAQITKNGNVSPKRKNNIKRSSDTKENPTTASQLLKEDNLFITPTHPHLPAKSFRETPVKHMILPESCENSETMSDDCASDSPMHTLIECLYESYCLHHIRQRNKYELYEESNSLKPTPEPVNDLRGNLSLNEWKDEFFDPLVETLGISQSELTKFYVNQHEMEWKDVHHRLNHEIYKKDFTSLQNGQSSLPSPPS